MWIYTTDPGERTKQCVSCRNSNCVDNTALMLALNVGAMEVLEVLLRDGADVNCASTYGEVPLSLAISLNDTQALQLSVDYGVNVNSKVMTLTGVNTPLLLSHQVGNLDMLYTMIRNLPKPLLDLADTLVISP